MLSTTQKTAIIILIGLKQTFPIINLNTLVLLDIGSSLIIRSFLYKSILMIVVDNPITLKITHGLRNIHPLR